jgi:putative nucleotidyltransferase with HDIG domain
MRGIAIMDKAAVTAKPPLDRETHLMIEDGSGARSFLPWNDTLIEYEYLFALRGNEDFLGDPGNSAGRFPWSGNVTQGQKIFQAREAMKDLNRWYERLFRGHEEMDEDIVAEKQLFFNSNLIHFIAATDANEDTVGHSQFVANYSLLLTRELGISDRRFLVDIERGALLHDIGKIGIPESILMKNGPLTTIEREIIKDHPLLGYKLIEEFSFLKQAALVVLCHHEHFDGRGYPYGLVGEEIPLEARIFSLADTVDAITSDRPYRQGQSFDAARREIEKHGGTQFDPQLVEAFLNISEERWLKAKLETLRNLRLPTVH